MNNCKRSLRASTNFRPDKARTQKRAKSFFQLFLWDFLTTEIFILSREHDFALFNRPSNSIYMFCMSDTVIVNKINSKAQTVGI